MKPLLSTYVFKQSLRGNFKFLIVIPAVMSLMLFIMSLIVRSGEVPMHGRMTLLGVYSSVFFQLPGIILLLVFLVAIGTKLVVSEVDRGTLAFTLNTPTTRLQIILTKAAFYVAAIAFLATVIGTAGTIIAASKNVDFEYAKYWTIIFGYALFAFATGGIVFAASCHFNKSGNTLAIGAGLPVAFFLIGMLAGLQDLEWLRFFTINSWFEPAKIATGGAFVWQFVTLFATGVALFAFGIVRFVKKDLPL